MFSQVATGLEGDRGGYVTGFKQLHPSLNWALQPCYEFGSKSSGLQGARNGRTKKKEVRPLKSPKRNQMSKFLHSTIQAATKKILEENYV